MPHVRFSDRSRSAASGRRKRRECLAGVFPLLLLAAGPPTPSFEKVVDTTTDVPGGTSRFMDLWAPSIDGGEVAFYGSGFFGQSGVYTDAGGSLRAVADENTAIPGGTGDFTRFGRVASISNGEVAFLGNGSSGQSGIYIDAGGSLGVVADESTSGPGGTGSFTDFSVPSLDEGDVAFFGVAGSVGGIFTDAGGPLRSVADGNTPIPGGTGNFTGLDTGFSVPARIDAGVVTFRGTGVNGQIGIYTDAGGPLRVVADRNTAIPGGTGSFKSLFGGAVDDGVVGLTGSGSTGQNGIYTEVGGTLGVVVDESTAVPGGMGSFTTFSPPAIDDGSVAFRAFGTAVSQAIYVERGGMLLEIIAVGDTLDGRTVDALDLGEESLSGDQVAFLAGFTDGIEGIFVATIPEASPVPSLGPLGLAFLAAALVAVGLSRARA